MKGIMFRNRGRNAARNNARKKNRNVRRVEASDDDSFSSDSWDSSTLSDLDSSETTDEVNLPSSSTSRKPNTRRSSGRKPSRKNTKKANPPNVNAENGGPSTAGTSSSSCSDSQHRNVACKRKCKGNSRIFDSDETSSDDFSTTIRVKRFRHSHLESDDDTDDSVLLPTVRRNAFLLSDSSSSSNSSEINLRIGRGRRSNLPSQVLWSSDDTDDAFLNISAGNVGRSMNIDTSTTSSSSASSTTSSSSSSSSSLSSTSSSSLFSSDSSFASILTIDTCPTSNESSHRESCVNPREQMSSDSDDSDSDGEKCAICLKRFRTQQIGCPSNCDHCFCRKCLEEWSKSSTTCPVDRSVFDAIIVKNAIDGDVVERVEVQNRNFVILGPPVEIEELAMNDTIICENCGSGEDEETLLLCDLCNLGYHMACLSPPLDAIPAGSWHCPPCRLLYRNPNRNVREAMHRFISALPFSSVSLSPTASTSRQNQTRRRRNNRARIPGPPSRGRGPTTSRRLGNVHAIRSDLADVIEYDQDVSAAGQQPFVLRSGRQRRAGVENAPRNDVNDVAAQMARYFAEIANSRARIDRRLDEMLTVVDSQSPSTSRPSEIVDMVFPTFSLFGNNDLEYFSDDESYEALEGEVAVMARVQSEYSARRMESRKSIASNLTISQRRRPVDVSVVEMSVSEECGGDTTSLLDSILESQTLWHSKNVEISSKRDGKLEIRLRKGEEKRPDLSNTSHTSKEIPLYPNKNESSASDSNKSYAAANNTRYSNLGGNAASSGSASFSQSTSFFNSLNPSTRPGFSNLLGNNSSALDLSPFRGTAPIRFRMNPPRAGLRRNNYNANARHATASSAVAANASRRASSGQAGRCAGATGEDDVDLYDDIETENAAEMDRSSELYSSLEPPPEPPALLIGTDSSSEEDDGGLIIDDKAGSSNKSNIYDPTEPNEDSDEERERNKNAAPDYMRSPSYGSISNFGPHLPLPEPPALPIELESVNNSDSEEEAEFPNMNLYSKTSITLANNVQDIPIPDAEYPSTVRQDAFLDAIPIPSKTTTTPTTPVVAEDVSASRPISELYSPSKKASSDSESESDSDVVETKVRDTRSGDRRPSSSDDGRSSSDRESARRSRRPSPSRNRNRNRRRNRKHSADGGGKRKSNRRSINTSSGDESYEEDGESFPRSEKCDLRRRSRDSSTERGRRRRRARANSTRSIEKCSDGGTRARISPPIRKTSSKEEATETYEIHELDGSESCDRDAVDSVDVVTVLDDQSSPTPTPTPPPSSESPVPAFTADGSADSASAELPSELEEQRNDDDDANSIEQTRADGDESAVPLSRVISLDESSEKDEASMETEEVAQDVAEDAPPKDDGDANQPDSNVVVAATATASAGAGAAYLLPSDDLDPVSDVEDNDFAAAAADYQKSKERRRKRKKGRKRDSSSADAKGERELEEGEIEEERAKKKRSGGETTKKRRTNDSDELLTSSKKTRRRRERERERERKDRTNAAASGEGKEAAAAATSKSENSFTWKKLSKSTKERNYRDRDGKAKPDVAAGGAAAESKNHRERESNKKKEKRKEIERYDVRKILSEKPRIVRDEFGRDVSAARSRSRSVSLARSCAAGSGRAGRSKERGGGGGGGGGGGRRSLSQVDRWIDWSPVWTNQRRSRSRSRSRSRTRSPSATRARAARRNRNRPSGGGGGGDRYRNDWSKGRPTRDSDKGGGREPRKRKRSLSSVERYSPPPPASMDKKRNKRSSPLAERARRRSASSWRRSVSRDRASAERFYEAAAAARSWSRSPSLYAARMTPERSAYSMAAARYAGERSPSSMVEAGVGVRRLSVVSPEPGSSLLAPSAQNLTVIVANREATKKRHKKKSSKESKKRKRKQPLKEVFTKGDNIVVSVNFDDNQKIISAKSSSSKRSKNNEQTNEGATSGGRSKKKRGGGERKKRKQTLRVGDEVLNAKPVAVIDLNTSPCKEMSPVEVISLTDSGDENATGGGVGGSGGECQSRQTTGETVAAYIMTNSGPKTPPEPSSSVKFTVGSQGALRTVPTNPIFVQDDLDCGVDASGAVHYNKGPNTPPEPSNTTPNATMYDPFEPTKSRSPSPALLVVGGGGGGKEAACEERQVIDMFAGDSGEKTSEGGAAAVAAAAAASDKSKLVDESKESGGGATTATALVEDAQSTTATTAAAIAIATKPSPAKEASSGEGSSGGGGGDDAGAESSQMNGVNTLVLDLSSLGDDFVPKSSIPLVKTSQGKYEFQSSKAAPDKPITVVIAQQSTSSKPQPQQVMVTPTRQIPTKPVEPVKQPMFPDILPWKLPMPLSQASFTTPSSALSTVAPTALPSKSGAASIALTQQNGGGGGGGGNQNESAIDLDDSPYSPASSEGDDLFEPPPLNANLSSPKSRSVATLPAVNSYKSRMDALFNSSPAKKFPRPLPHSKPMSAIKGAKKIPKSNIGSKKEVGIKADEEQLKILDDVPNSAVEMIVKEKFLKKLHRQERVVEEVKVVLKPHYAKKHITKEEYKDILRRAVPKICHNKSGDINPSKIQGLVEAYVKKIRHSKKKVTTMNALAGSTVAPMFPSIGGMANVTKVLKKPKNLWG